MSARAKLILKIVLAITFPVWVVPALVLFLVWMIGLLVWDISSNLVEDLGWMRMPPR